MKDCPVNKPICPCEFSKESLCDYPYSQDMNYQECHNLSVAMRVVAELYERCLEIDLNNPQIAS